MTQDRMAALIDKDEIQELVLLYSRGVDRQDFPLLRTLYAAGGTDEHGDSYSGGAEGYVDFLERGLPHLHYSGHHVCNHLISVDGDTGEGEVYAIAYHVIPDGAGGMIEDLMLVRYIDRYVREDGRWRFARRVVTYDVRTRRPFTGTVGAELGSEDPSRMLASRLFARGARA